MKEFPIPVVGVGAGSQPEDEELQYLPLPGSMMTFALPVINVEADPAVLAAACTVVEQLREKMQATPLGTAPIPSIALHEMNPDVVRLLNQTMGEGEVSIAVRGSGQYRIQETVFASVWRVHEYASDASLIGDTLMACAIPPIVIRWAQDDASPECTIPEKTAGIMNAPAVLTEIMAKSNRHGNVAAPNNEARHARFPHLNPLPQAGEEAIESLREFHVKAYKSGDSAHVINLTLLPMSPEDLDYLSLTLGVGAVTILSRGYGNCRITSTKLPNVWWVQYFNSMDTLILNTIEVSEMPEVALAAKEDYEDSIERLGEWLQVMQSVETADA